MEQDNHEDKQRSIVTFAIDENHVCHSRYAIVQQAVWGKCFLNLFPTDEEMWLPALKRKPIVYSLNRITVEIRYKLKSIFRSFFSGVFFPRVPPGM